MTQLTVDVELDEHGQPVFRLTQAQAAALGLQADAAREARWEVEAVSEQQVNPLLKYVGIAPELEEGSLEYYRKLKGHAD